MIDYLSYKICAYFAVRSIILTVLLKFGLLSFCLKLFNIIDKFCLLKLGGRTMSEVVFLCVRFECDFKSEGIFYSGLELNLTAFIVVYRVDM